MFDTKYLKSLTVLFVEDEDLARELLAKILSKIFKNVITSANGLDGFEKFKESQTSIEKIDLIISDINMPIMNGLEMLENIRKIDSDVPTIFLTARNETNNILRAIDLNITNYVIKPIQTNILLEKIADACEKRYIKNQLNEKQNELEKYLEAVDHVALIYRMDEEGNITFGNKSLLETSLYSLEELTSLKFDDLIHPDIPKESLEKIWEFIRKGDLWSGNTKFITKNEEEFYLKNKIFKVKINLKYEYITIGFVTTQESIEKREFHKKVLKSIQEFNKKEYKYKKLVIELNDRVKQLESYLPRIHQELEEQKGKTLSKHRQLEHYEMQMHNVDEKYSGQIIVKSKEIDEYSRIIAAIKQEKIYLFKKIKKQKKKFRQQKKN